MPLSARENLTVAGRLRIAGILLLVITFLHGIVWSQEPGFSKRFDTMIEKGLTDNHIPGLAIGIVIDGRLVYSRGFGEATLGGDKVTPDTLFHMASITKPFVATAIMQLVEQGKIGLGDPLIKYLPYFQLADTRYRSITIRQLLNHTSGMPDVGDYEWDKPQYDEPSLERYVRGLKNRKLLSAPGTKFAYSNIGFEILADVIAKVSGISFEDYVERNILIPVGMRSSTLLKEKSDAKRLASGYDRDKKGMPVPIKAYPYNRPHNASSDLMSSINDMARWAIANLNRGELDGKRILNTATYELMWKPTSDYERCSPGTGRCEKIGLSWFLSTQDGLLQVSHGGADDGFVSYLLLVPERKFAVVMMANSYSAGIPLVKQVMADALALAK